MFCPQKITYVIRRNDTLFALASRFNTTVELILQLNPGIDANNLQIGSTIYICPNNDGENNLDKLLSISNAMRLVWLQHVYWLRMYTISLLDELDDLSATRERLMEIPGVTADIFADFAQPDAVTAISSLISEHFRLGGRLILAIKNDDMNAAEEINQVWRKNASDIASVFTSISSKYDFGHIRDMIYAHLDAIISQAAMRLAKNHEEEVKVFNDMEQGVLSFADYLTMGLVT